MTLQEAIARVDRLADQKRRMFSGSENREAMEDVQALLMASEAMRHQLVEA